LNAEPANAVMTNATIAASPHASHRTILFFIWLLFFLK
jgi:hypothetical protein